MTKEKWQSMTDEEKTAFMRKVYKDMYIGDSFDYAKCRNFYEWMTKQGHGMYGVYQNPCIVLELVDPVMATYLMGWMYSCYDDNGEHIDYTKGETAPLFGYNMVELYFDKGSMMNFSDDEKSILREAMRIIGEKTKENNQ